MGWFTDLLTGVDSEAQKAAEISGQARLERARAAREAGASTEEIIEASKPRDGEVGFSSGVRPATSSELLETGVTNPDAADSTASLEDGVSFVKNIGAPPKDISTPISFSGIFGSLLNFGADAGEVVADQLGVNIDPNETTNAGVLFNTGVALGAKAAEKTKEAVDITSGLTKNVAFLMLIGLVGYIMIRRDFL